MNDNLQPIGIGDVIADTYRVEEKLGEGGMGIVAKARHLRTGALVAIKWIRPEVANHEALARFDREARAASTLKSEHVCRASDVGLMANGAPYMVMEYLEGEDLSCLLQRRGRLPIHEAVDVVLQLCRAMGEAHAAGIVHRDLKPKNIYISRRADGSMLVKVLDFGISKIETNADLQLTRTTEIIGSPSYMSPEQLRASRDVDLRTDIWALGVILFELLTNQIPFQAEAVTQLIAIVLMEQQPSVRSFRPEVPAGIERVIARCLEKQSLERFQGVAELAYALEAFRGPVAGDIPKATFFGETAVILPASSQRVMVHGGTSVAWGETQMDTAKRPSRWPAFAIAIATLLVVGGTAGTAAIMYEQHAEAAPAQPGAAMPLPQSRKDLTPIDAKPVAPTDNTPNADPIDLSKIEPSFSKPLRGPAAKPSAKPASDPLLNIGRR